MKQSSGFRHFSVVSSFVWWFVFLLVQTGFTQTNNLFDSDEPLSITLKGNVRDLLNDRTNAVPKNFPLELLIRNADSSVLSIPVQVKTRGHFRRMKENCNYPPLLIQFEDINNNGIYKKTIFRNQRKLKLVMPCKGMEYTVKEWLVYKMYNLVTPLSFKARLVQVTLEDAKAKKPVEPFYGILLEEEEQMAKRNQLVLVEKKIQPQQAQVKPFLTMAVFEYMIGNTDWSVQYLQNTKLVAKDSLARPTVIPYDFDHSGIVNAPYALPAPELQMSSVRERRYRGYCLQGLNQFDEILALFNQLKDKMYALYTTSTVLDARSIKSGVQFLDEFYATINNPKAWQKDFSYPCDKNGTGNVVIKGLRTD
ncbi:MAG: hypothetical protein ABI761_15645 [Saprospiraceae bacterium]